MYRASLVALFILLLATGHYGGNMTHGDDYLTAGMPPPLAGWLGVEQEPDTIIVRPVITDIMQAGVYNDLVVPIFSEKCISCHSAKKMKGALRMDTEALLFKGGKHGSIITAGNAASSELIRRILLPLHEDEHMAPRDQEQLTEQEISLLRWWIDKGADTHKKISELQPDSAMLLQLAVFSQAGKTDNALAAADSITPLSDVYAKETTEASPEVLALLRSKGIIIQPVSLNGNWLELSCVNFSGFDGSLSEKLLELKDQLVSLKLDDTGITDSDMKIIGQLKNLVRLSLSGTAITGAGLKSVSELPALEYINITHTKVQDAGLQELAACKKLKAIYCWNEFITEKGIQQLQTALPAAKITGRIF